MPLAKASFSPSKSSIVPNQLIESISFGLKGTETPAHVTNPSSLPPAISSVALIASSLPSDVPKSASISASRISMPITSADRDSINSRVAAPMPDADPVIAIVPKIPPLAIYNFRLN